MNWSRNNKVSSYLNFIQPNLLADPAGKHFNAAIRLELHKISAFFIEKEEELEVRHIEL